jgi:hypothetical protein
VNGEVTEGGISPQRHREHGAKMRFWKVFKRTRCVRFWCLDILAAEPMLSQKLRRGSPRCG